VIIFFLSALKEANDERFFSIFMKDEAKIHLHHVKKIRQDADIKRFAF
jgi:hypothetical protein